MIKVRSNRGALVWIDNGQADVCFNLNRGWNLEEVIESFKHQ